MSSYVLGWLVALRELIVKLGVRTQTLLSTMVLKPQLASESDVRLDKTQIAGPQPRSFCSSGSGMGSKNLHFQQIPLEC